MRSIIITILGAALCSCTVTRPKWAKPYNTSSGQAQEVAPIELDYSK